MLTSILKESDLDKIEGAAIAHKRYGNISFCITSISKSMVVFRVFQGPNVLNIYHSSKRLVEIVNETFGMFFKDRTIVASAIPFKKQLCKSERITAAYRWIYSHIYQKLVDLMSEQGLEAFRFYFTIDPKTR